MLSHMTSDPLWHLSECRWVVDELMTLLLTSRIIPPNPPTAPEICNTIKDEHTLCWAMCRLCNELRLVSPYCAEQCFMTYEHILCWAMSRLCNAICLMSTYCVEQWAVWVIIHDSWAHIVLSNEQIMKWFMTHEHILCNYFRLVSPYCVEQWADCVMIYDLWAPIVLTNQCCL